MTAAHDGPRRQAAAAQATQDTLIAAEVMRAHRQAWARRYPGSVEHCLRLVTERLQACLAKPPGTVLADPTTWPADAHSIAQLSSSLAQLHSVWLTLPHSHDD